MSTRSLIGVGKPDNFRAQYCHWDGYPSGNGKTLWDNWTRTFAGDLQKLADFILSSQHGWSYIVDCDFSLEPRWMEKEEREKNLTRACWYDDRIPMDHRGPKKYWNQNDVEYGLFDPEWVYLMDIAANEINVYAVASKGLVFRGKMTVGKVPDFKAME